MKHGPLSKLFVAFAYLFSISIHTSAGELFPKQDAMLSYRIIGFSFPTVAGATGYKVEIADGQLTETDEFEPVISSGVSADDHIILTVPSFGRRYTWHIIYFDGGRKTGTSPLYYFSTNSSPKVDTFNYRLRVTRQKADAEFYVMPGTCNVLYDATGNPVWYLQQPDGVPDYVVSDAKYTAQHTLTYLYGNDAVESDYNGKVLWRKSPVYTPGDGSADEAMFHHEFSRLANGNYMCLACKRSVSPDNEPAKNSQGRHHFFASGTCSVLYEFDSLGNVVWAWKSEEYLKQSDLALFYQDMAKATPTTGAIPAHENAFYFDEPHRVIYLSYVTFNRIIKISYPSGKILDVYGPAYTKSSAIAALSHPESTPVIEIFNDVLFRNNLFTGQHCIRLDPNGNLLLYNNNMGRKDLPEIVALAPDGPNMLKKTFVYQCPLNDPAASSVGPEGTLVNGGGGSVYRLPDGSIFASANAPYSKLFIVNDSGMLQWSALPEKRQSSGQWGGMPSYRAVILSKTDLENFIWQSEGIAVTDQPIIVRRPPVKSHSGKRRRSVPAH